MNASSAAETGNFYRQLSRHLRLPPARQLILCFAIALLKSEASPQITALVVISYKAARMCLSVYVSPAELSACKPHPQQ